MTIMETNSVYLDQFLVYFTMVLSWYTLLILTLLCAFQVIAIEDGDPPFTHIGFLENYENLIAYPNVIIGIDGHMGFEISNATYIASNQTMRLTFAWNVSVTVPLDDYNLYGYLSQGFCGSDAGAWNPIDKTFDNVTIISHMITGDVLVAECNRIYYLTLRVSDGIHDDANHVSLIEHETAISHSTGGHICLPIEIRCPTFGIHAPIINDDMYILDVKRKAGPPHELDDVNVAGSDDLSDDLQLFDLDMHLVVEQVELPGKIISVNATVDVVGIFNVSVHDGHGFHIILGMDINVCGLSGIQGDGRVYNEFTDIQLDTSDAHVAITCGQNIYITLEGSADHGFQHSRYVTTDNTRGPLATHSGFRDYVCVRIPALCIDLNSVNAFNMVEFRSSNENGMRYNLAVSNPFTDIISNFTSITLIETLDVLPSGNPRIEFTLNYNITVSGAAMDNEIIVETTLGRNLCGVNPDSPKFMGHVGGGDLTSYPSNTNNEDRSYSGIFELDSSACGEIVQIQTTLTSSAPGSNWIYALTFGDATTHGISSDRALCVQYRLLCDQIPPSPPPDDINEPWYVLGALIGLALFLLAFWLFCMVLASRDRRRRRTRRN